MSVQSTTNLQETAALANSPGVTPLERYLMKFGEETFMDFGRYRFAEEREWYEMALFYQKRQWLSWNEGKRTWDLAKPDKKKPRPMPVSNYFAKTINANANALGAELPKILATPNDDDPINRRAADMVQRAKEAIDKETSMAILNPLLAKQTALFGIGCTYDYYDMSLSNGVTKANMLSLKTTNMVGCLNCGGSYDVGPTPQPNEQGQVPCPQCSNSQTFTYPEHSIASVEQKSYAKGKLCTDIVPIFEVFVSRDCGNLNMAKRVLQRTRISIGTIDRMYPDLKGQVKTDQQLDLNTQYYNSLKAVVNYNYMQEQTQPAATVTRVWSFWEELSEEVQEQLTLNFSAEPDKLEAMMERGIYLIYTPGLMLDWGINPYYDEDAGKPFMPYTFFIWEMDPANVYNKSVGTDLVQLQRRLNRLDSLVELALMSNAAGKWIWPKTNTSKPPNGSPNDVVEYDPIGVGKEPPKFVQPSPFHGVVLQIRMSILADFNALGMTEAVSTGAQPQGGATAFRALAYLGSKADEQLSTQRVLWETSHQLRYEKCLQIAKTYWQEPRKVKVAGFNGKFKSQELKGDDLRGSYNIEFVKDSSRPKTLQEKQAALATLFQAGLVNPQDPATREYIADSIGMNGINLIDHRQFEKAERMLDQVMHGQEPVLVPGIDWNIAFGIFTDYTLTEEYEEQDPMVQAAVSRFAAQIGLKLAEDELKAQGGTPVPTPGMPAGATRKPAGHQVSPQQKQIGDAMAQHAHPGSTGASAQLQQVPGPGNVDNTEAAAATEGQSVAQQLP